MDSEQLRIRTKKYAAEIVRFVDNLPRGVSYEVMGRQLLRSATSTAANYRAACRAGSKPILNRLCKEGKEILAIFSAAQKTARTSKART